MGKMNLRYIAPRWVVPKRLQSSRANADPRIAGRLRLNEAVLAAVLADLLSRAQVVLGQLSLPGVTCDSKDDAVVSRLAWPKVSWIVLRSVPWTM